MIEETRFDADSRVKLPSRQFPPSVKLGVFHPKNSESVCSADENFFVALNILALTNSGREQNG